MSAQAEQSQDHDGGTTHQEHESFDGVLADLQHVVEQLERSDMPLEQALRTFEKGVALARRGQQMLDAAERRVEVLLEDGSTEPLDSDIKP